MYLSISKEISFAPYNKCYGVKLIPNIPKLRDHEVTFTGNGEKVFENANANRPIVGLVSTDRSMVAALLNTTPRPVTKSSANDSTPRP
jgi:hypothetical protein